MNLPYFGELSNDSSSQGFGTRRAIRIITLADRIIIVQNSGVWGRVTPPRDPIKISRDWPVYRRYRKLHLRTAGVHARLSTSDNEKDSIRSAPGRSALRDAEMVGPEHYG